MRKGRDSGHCWNTIAVFSAFQKGIIAICLAFKARRDFALQLLFCLVTQRKKYFVNKTLCILYNFNICQKFCIQVPVDYTFDCNIQQILVEFSQLLFCCINSIFLSLLFHCLNFVFHQKNTKETVRQFIWLQTWEGCFSNKLLHAKIILTT